MSAQAEERTAAGGLRWRLNAVLNRNEPADDTRALRYGRYLTAAMAALLLVYYCVHPELYAGEKGLRLLESGKTYVVMAVVFLLIALALTPMRLAERTNRFLSWCWFVIAPFAVYFSLLYLNATKFNIHFLELNKIALGFTFAFLFLFETFFVVLTGSIRFSAVILAVSVAVLGIANCFVISFRGMALSAADLFSIGTAMTVASNYTYTVDWYIYMEVLCTFTICLVSLKLSGGRMLHPLRRIALLAAWCVLAGGYYHICCRTDFLERHDIRSKGFTHQLRYKEYDMLFTTLTTCFYLSVDKPDGYSAERVKEIAAPYLQEDTKGADGGVQKSDTAGTDGGVQKSDAAGADGGVQKSDAAGADGSVQKLDAAGADDGVQKSDAAGADGGMQKSDTAAVGGASESLPNLIVIMNEAFADYSQIGRGLDFSEDAMPFIHGLTENTIRGTFYSSIFGGNTPNSEYEFLTGNTMGFLPESSVGFHLFVRGALPSIASQLKAAGYETLAMHPYRGTNYRRHIVYPQLGFDEFYTRDDFPRADYIRNYISDEELYNRIITEYHNRQDSGKPFFSYNVTIQNHSDYFASNTRDLELEIEVENEEVDQVRSRIYANLIRESDDAFRKLVQHFEREEEPTVILMFGDHQANLGDDTYRYLVGDEEELTPEERMEKYKVPFVAWANYDIPEEEIERTSLNYLYSILADRLGLPMTGYQTYLLALSEEIPVLCAQGCFGADGAYYELDDESSPYYEKIQEYNILEYNDIFGGDQRYLEFFGAK